MRRSLTRFRGVLLALGLVAAQSCSHHETELPTPVASLVTAGVSIGEAQTWYLTAYPSAAPAPTPSRQSKANAIASVVAASPSTPATLVWSRALTVGTGAQQLVLVPLAGDQALFAHSTYAGPRYLIIAKTAANALDGHLVELLLRRSATPVDTLALFTGLYRSYRSGHLAAPSTGEGYVLLYSADYQYLTGRHFRQGQLLAGTSRLAFQAAPGTAATSSPKGGGFTANNVAANDPCLDWYNAFTGEYITNTGNCNYGGEPYFPPFLGDRGPSTGGGSSSPAPSGPTGHGGGHGAPASPDVPSPDSPTVILNLSLTPCQTAVLTDLQKLNNGMLSYIVTMFGGTTKGYNWKLQNGTLATGIFGSTGPYNSTYKYVETTFDSNQWRSATDLTIARTMLHEAVHAYLVSYFANDRLQATATYKDLVAAYAAAGVADPNIPHHNAMGQGWVGDLAWALQQYGISKGYSLPSQFYSDMAWGGLEGSDAFNKLSQTDQARINDLISVQITGRDMQGNYQTQAGSKAGCP